MTLLTSTEAQHSAPAAKNPVHDATTKLCAKLGPILTRVGVECEDFQKHIRLDGRREAGIMLGALTSHLERMDRETVNEALVAVKEFRGRLEAQVTGLALRPRGDVLGWIGSVVTMISTDQLTKELHDHTLATLKDLTERGASVGEKMPHSAEMARTNILTQTTPLWPCRDKVAPIEEGKPQVGMKVGM